MKSPLLRFKGSIAILIFTCCSLALFAGNETVHSSSSPAAEAVNPFISFVSKRSNTLRFLSDSEVSIRTSKSNYTPGETAKISGDGFRPGELVTLQVVHVNGPAEPGAGHEPWTVSADQSGYLSSTWYVNPDDSAGATFLLTANGVLGSTASYTFTDAANPSADLDQCRNGSSASPSPCVGDGSGGSGWVNGNVGSQQGHYIEGYVIPYRMRMSNLAAGNWTLDIGYDTVHSGAHAIDFLTHYDLIGGTSAAPTVPDHTLVFNHTAECIDPSDSWIGLPGNANNCAGAALTSTLTIPKPILPLSVAGNPPGTPPCTTPYPGGTVIAGATSCPGTTFDAINGAGKEFMTMWNGTITGIQYVQGQQNVVAGTGQQHTMVRVYFTVSGANATADGGNVDLAWGGHIGRATDWGAGNSAGGISGSPYHMNLHGLCAGSTPNDGTLCTDGGSQDRSLSAAAVFATGTVIINKVLQGTPDGTFHYAGTGTGISSTFDLTTVGGTATTTFTGVPAGAKTVVENGPSSPYLFVSLSCTDPDNGTTVTGQTANIDVDAGETVTCTYTNRVDQNAVNGRIIVVKEVPGTGDTTQFTFNPSSNFSGQTGSTFTAPFNLSDGQNKDSCGVGDNCLAPDTYTVGETANAEYTTTSNCVSSLGDPDEAPSAIHLRATEVVTCTFTNTPKSPSLSITKTADATSVSAGDPIGFTITVSNASGATVGTAKGVTLSDALPAGTGVDWGIASQSGGASCVINGAPPTETLACGPIDLAPGASFSVHVTSGTTEASCKAYANTATAQATNHGQVTANATETVRCPNLSITKVADATSVSAGSPIGFTITVTNSAAAGTGTAKGVTLADALPAGTGVDWGIASQTGGASCVINGAPPTENLACGPIDLAPGASFSVHVTSNTTEASCKAYPNTATADATNAPPINANATETVLCPNLSITKVADATSVSAGSPIGFTITVSNSAAAGTGTALGVTLADALPAGTGVDWGIASQTGGASCVINGAPPTENLACGPIDLAPGASFSVHITSATTEASCKAYPNTATADATNAPPINANATETVLCPNLSITKVADATSVSAGSPIGFTITVSNSGAAGTGTALGVTLADALPAGTGVDWGIASQTGGASCVINGAPPTENLACGPIDLAPGASFSVHITSGTTEASCKAYPNTATADATNAPPINANATETVLCPNLSITKVADAASVNAGQPIGFTITVSNSAAAGTGTAKAVTLADALPAGTGVDWGIASQSGGASCVINGAPPAENLACGPIDLAPGASFSVHITSNTTEASCKAYPNTATADATNAPPINANATETVLCPGLTITKVADAASVSAGSPIGFTITVSNSAAAGTGTALGVTLADALPAGTGVDWTIASQSGGASCVINGAPPAENLACGPIDLAPGASFSVHITSNTTEASCKAYPNTATADATNSAPVNANATETVLCPNLSITKTADAALVDAGGTIGFTITVSNNGAAGTGTAKGVTLSDALPAGGGVDWGIASQSGGAGCVINGAPPAETLACGPIDLAPGASFSVHVTSGTTAASCKTYQNTATADATNAPPVNANANLTVQCSDVSVTKVADADSVDAPGNVGFTITVTSNGPATAHNVTLTDVLPTNTGLSWSVDGGTGAAFCSISTGTLTCNFGTMASGASFTVHIVSSTIAATCGTVNNTATVTASLEPNTSNNSASDSEDVRCGTIVIIKNAKPQSGSFDFNTTGTDYDPFTLTGSTAGGGNVNTQTPLLAGPYTATEVQQAGWLLTGIGGDAVNPFSCTVTGGNGSTGVGDLNTATVTISLKAGDTVTCVFENTADFTTRTQGFWATHSPLANAAWFGGTAFGHTFPGVPQDGIGPVGTPCRTIPDLATLMGGFWSGISKTSTNKKRNPLDQARMQLLQQLLAAELNFSAFGSTPAGGFATIQAWENAYCGTDQNAIKLAATQAAAFNESGDSGAFTPGTSADAKNAKTIANYATWDNLP